MKKRIYLYMALILTLTCILSGCGQNNNTEAETTENTGSITLLNIKSEVASQIEALGQGYEKETGIKVNVITVQSGVDSQATLKGYYLSDQMPDIIACESSGFSNWEGLWSI